MRPWLSTQADIAIDELGQCQPDLPIVLHRQNTRKPILIVLHQEHSTPGRVGWMLQRLGYRLDIRRPRFGEPLPETLAGHAGAVIFGGPMSANDPEEFIKAETDWIEVPLREKAPFLGLCLGAQMLALKLGRPVTTHPEARVEMGYYHIDPTEAAGAISTAPFPRWVYQWHSEGFELPSGAACLATGEDFECQAFGYGERAYGLQFHPEVTYAMICRWTVRGFPKLAAQNAAQPAQHKQDWFLHDGAVGRWLGGFLDAWLGHPSGV